MWSFWDSKKFWLISGRAFPRVYARIAKIFPTPEGDRYGRWVWLAVIPGRGGPAGHLLKNRICGCFMWNRIISRNVQTINNRSRRPKLPPRFFAGTLYRGILRRRFLRRLAFLSCRRYSAAVDISVLLFTPPGARFCRLSACRFSCCLAACRLYICRQLSIACRIYHAVLTCSSAC